MQAIQAFSWDASGMLEQSSDEGGPHFVLLSQHQAALAEETLRTNEQQARLTEKENKLERHSRVILQDKMAKVEQQQRVWLMRFSKYGDTTDLRLYDELRRRDHQLQQARQQFAQLGVTPAFDLDIRHTCEEGEAEARVRTDFELTRANQNLERDAQGNYVIADTQAAWIGWRECAAFMARR
ncbi:MAG: hypothetical protein RSG77_26735 [Hafnia sp.]